MEAILYLSEWFGWMAALIAVGAGTSFSYFAFRTATAFDENKKSEYQGKMMSALKGAVVGITIASTVAVIKNFYT